jgi:hypothetical protein
LLASAPSASLVDSAVCTVSNMPIIGTRTVALNTTAPEVVPELTWMVTCS